MPLIDISLPLTPGMPSWPGQPGFTLSPVKRIAAGENDNVTAISMSLHSGTHLDMPWHFLEDGPRSETVSLEALNGSARVVDVDDPVSIKLASLETLDFRSGERLLFRTRNSQIYGAGRFTPDFVYLEPDAALYLASLKIRLVGVDYLSIEKFGDSEAPTHKTLLSAGIPILEGLDLSAAAPGDYRLSCLPLRIPGVEALPVRALLETYT